MRFWVLHPDSKEPRGPYTVEQLKDLGWVDRESVAAREDAGTADDWRPVNAFPELFEAFPPPVPEAGIPRTQRRSAGSLSKFFSPPVLAAAAAAGALSVGAFFLGRGTGADGAPPKEPAPASKAAGAPARTKAAAPPHGRHGTVPPRRRKARKRHITAELGDGDDSWLDMELPKIESVRDLQAQIAEDERREKAFKEALKKAIEAAQEEEAADAAEEGKAKPKAANVMNMSVAELEKYLGRHKSSEDMAERLRCEMLRSTDPACGKYVISGD